MKASRHILVLFELSPPRAHSTRHRILCDLPAQALFELEQAPFLPERLVSPIQPYQEEIGQDGQGNRVSDTLRLFGDLHLPQVQSAFEFFKQDFHTPTPRVYAEDRPSTRLGEIGHDDLY